MREAIEDLSWRNITETELEVMFEFRRLQRELYDYRDNCEFWTLPRVWTHIDGALPIMVTEDVENLYSFAPIASVVNADSVVLELTANEMISPETVRRKANLAAESLAISLSIG